MGGSGAMDSASDATGGSSGIDGFRWQRGSGGAAAAKRAPWVVRRLAGLSRARRGKPPARAQLPKGTGALGGSGRRDEPPRARPAWLELRTEEARADDEGGAAAVVVVGAHRAVSELGSCSVLWVLHLFTAGGSVQDVGLNLSGVHILPHRALRDTKHPGGGADNIFAIDPRSAVAGAGGSYRPAGGTSTPASTPSSKSRPSSTLSTLEDSRLSRHLDLGGRD